MRGNTTDCTPSLPLPRPRRIAQALEHTRKEVVLEAVVERNLRGGAHHDDRPPGVEPQLSKDRGVGLEVGEVVLLLQPRVGAHLATCAIAVEALGWDRLGHDHRPRQAAVDLVLHGCPLVVEHRGTGDPQQGSGDAHVVGAMAERDVEEAAGEGGGGGVLAPRSPRLGVRPTQQRPRAQREAARLRGQPLPAVAADRGVGDLEAAQQPQRLGEVARGHPHLVAVALQRLDHRSHDQHVGAVGEVDPDAHRQTVSPGDSGQAPARCTQVS